MRGGAHRLISQPDTYSLSLQEVSMQAILDQIADWLKGLLVDGMLVDGIMNNLANFETWIIFKWIFKTTWISDHEDLKDQSPLGRQLP